ncbi:hypothetical protein ACPBEI_07295 [Latilactobacillus sakei]
MKVTYVEVADTWVIGNVSEEEMRSANLMANRYNGFGIKTIVVPDGFEVMRKYQYKKQRATNSNLGTCRTVVGAPIKNPKIANDLRLITGVLDDAKEYESIFVLIDEDKFETDLDALCTALQLLGLGCDIRKNLDKGDRALQIFNKEGIDL